MLWPRLIGIAFIGVAAWNVFKGRFVTSDDYGNRDLIDRRSKPFWFWFSVLLQLAVGAVFLSGLVKF